MDWRTRVAQDFDRLAPSWDRKHGPASFRRISLRLRSAWLRDLCESYRSPRLLDVGCGTGQQLLALAGHLDQGVGVDASPAMIERARRNADANGLEDRLRFNVLAAEDLSEERVGRFDVVLFGASLEHMADARRALARAAGVLRPGGAMVLVLVHPWHPRGLWARLAANTGAMPELRHLSPAEVRRCAAAAGLRPSDPFGPDHMRQASRSRRLPHRAWHGVLAPAAFGSYVALLTHGRDCQVPPAQG